MTKYALDIDPRGLIYESYRIDGISAAECRSIFLDWALGVPAGADMAGHLRQLLRQYGERNEEHPMTRVLREGLERAAPPKRRRGGRLRRG
ncbi:MAG: hypothetical protein ACE5FS_01510 [Paracoccaceae bacterium]